MDLNSPASAMVPMRIPSHTNSKSPSAPPPMKPRSPTRLRICAANSARASLQAAIATACTKTRSSASSPSAGSNREFRTGLSELLPSLRGDQIYAQVPAFSSGDRGMLDLLTLDRAGRLVVIELKADEDMHLPLQALDYWIRVRALNTDRQRTAGSDRPVSAFEREGYFPGAEVSLEPPRLLLAAPALRIHPANLPVLRYLSPQVDWELIALSEDWRHKLQIVFRKHPA